MIRVPVNKHGSFAALGAAIVAILLVVAGFILSKEMTRSAESVGSSTRPADPGSIQDRTPVGNNDKVQPPQKSNVPPATPQQ